VAPGCEKPCPKQDGFARYRQSGVFEGNTKKDYPVAVSNKISEQSFNHSSMDLAFLLHSGFDQIEV
jgi:hypothetical protein